jgi:hypothetical protein
MVLLFFTARKRKLMSNRLDIGKLSDFLSKPLVIFVLFAQFAAVIIIASAYHGRGSSEGCLYCHADKTIMARMGAPSLYVTREQVEKESNMPGVTCLDCHLGNGRSHEKDAAHKGMLSLIVLDSDLNRIPRKGRMDAIVPSGSDRLYSMFPKVNYDGEQVPDPDIFTVLWHDRDPLTLGYDKTISQKTCGKKGCHPQETEQYSDTVMGGNVRQRSSGHWLDTHGPNNCGPSFADLPPGDGAGFSEANYKIIKDDLLCPSSYRNATDRQRFCNVCHAGCLDCHYQPVKGMHSFGRRVSSENCTGGGRGTGMCHSGSQERRRGDSYLGAEFSQPPGLSTDAHYKKKMECMDCHETGEKGMGDMQRRVDCSGCHYAIVKAHDVGVHKKLRCQACHISTLGGYQMTVWGEGHVAGVQSPFKKYSLYYGTIEEPILIKDMEGMYTPYKVFPNVATNIKRPQAKRDGIEFRWPGGETRDAYAFLGTYGTLPKANLALAWIQLESVGHPLGKSRTCESCHGSETQSARAQWEYLGFAGSEPFNGTSLVTAGKDGLKITGFRNTTPIEMIGDAELADFAAWLYLGDIWNVKGDFSIPKSDPVKYREYLRQEGEFKSMLGLRAVPAKIKSIGEHNPKMAVDLLK